MEKLIFTNAYKNISNVIRQRRIEMKLQQKEFAELIHKSQTFVHRLETYQQRLDLNELYQICITTNLDFLEICTQFKNNIEIEK